MILRRLSLFAAAVLLLSIPRAAVAQASDSEPARTPRAGGVDWDDLRVQQLMQRARDRRQLPQADSMLKNYRARAEGFVYFYLDRRETDERTLVKTDQIALEVYWAPPNRTKQRIIGLRDESRLPNRMYYHLDHLTVVQDGFGDVIRMGDGDEVTDVPHPAAPGSDSIYSFRLADSMTIRLPGQASEIRVYEIQVRPHRVDRSALVGSLFVDRSGGDIVRMTFTFTPASYVDRRLDYISVSLDNGLWNGRYWLPNEQTLQIRRQIPELDFVAGAVIQGRMRITDYVFNDSLPAVLFMGAPIVALPESQRRGHDFERGIHDDLNRLGLAPPADLSDIRRQAASLLGTRRLSGLPSWRLSLESASSALRYNRAEGLAAGLGVTYAPGPPWRTDLTGGYAFGARRPWATVVSRRELPDGADLAVRLQLRSLRDVGLAAGVPTAINSIAGLFAGDDYIDPYYATGARIQLRGRVGNRWRAGVELAAERHRTAALTQQTALLGRGAEFRGIRPIDDRDVVSVTGSLRRTAPDPRSSSWSGTLEFEAGAADGDVYVRPTLDGRLFRASPDRSRTVALHASAGYISLDPPSQKLFVLGGTGTLPGYDYRAFAGRWYGLMQAEATASVWQPWLRFRVLAAAGAADGLTDPASSRLPADRRPAWHEWPATGSTGIRPSAGAGASFFWDLLRLDVVRGLRGGDWRLQVSFHPDFLDIS